MLENSDRELKEFTQYLSAKGLEAAFLMPTEGAFARSLLDANGSLSSYLRREGVHDYATQAKGGIDEVRVRTWIVGANELLETQAHLRRSDAGVPSIWITELPRHAAPGNLLAFFAHESELYILNTSTPGSLNLAWTPTSALSRLFETLTVARNRPLDDRYCEWNLRLLRSFFSEASRDEEVFLTVDRQLLDQIGQDIGGDAGFLSAVRAGPAWLNAREGFQNSINSLLAQRKSRPSSIVAYFKEPGDFDLTYRGHNAPAYLPHLAALVRNDAEHPHSYYEGLRKDLGLPISFGSSQMQLVESAWLDLQAWTQETKGQFGRFKSRTLGGYNRIGVPRSQSILHRSDIGALCHAFVSAEARPGEDPSKLDVARVFSEAKASTRLFSSPFRDALNDPAFEQPIRAAMRAAYADWDGTAPRKRDVDGASLSASGTHGAIERSVALSLSVKHQNPFDIEPQWRVPALHDTGRFRLSHQGQVWESTFFGTDGATTSGATEPFYDIWKVATGSQGASTDFELRCFTNEDAEPQRIVLTLATKKLWILTPKFDGANGGIELRESDLPAAGPAYLLAPPSNASRLKEYLQRGAPAHSIVTAAGLAPGWLLVCLHECASLSDEQRLLPDDEGGAHPRPRIIRFSGGRSIRRGYSRMYLPYDLPAVELDGDDRISLICTGDVKLAEVMADYSPRHSLERLLPSRRFRIELPHSNSASYELKAVRAGQIVSQIRLRIAGLSGESVDTGSAFCVDQTGRPSQTRDGLSGVLPEDLTVRLSQNEDASTFEIASAQLGVPTPKMSWEIGPRENFLDALARAGSIDYGVARDLIQRLFQQSVKRIDPPFLLLDLRASGQIEIATTQKGHIARIHSVQPTVYALPLLCENRRVYGVTGTLRISHWDRIASEGDAWAAFRSEGAVQGHGTLRLIAQDGTSMKSACEAKGFRFSADPAISIAMWSSNAETVERESFRHPMESIGGAEVEAMRFNASKGWFSATTTHRMVELWQVGDLDTRVDSLYVLADRGRFSFIRDSRWGKWIALNAFAKWARDELHLDGVYPPPLTYDALSGTVWLPARISLPSVLERALVLCSGDVPAAITAEQISSDDNSDRLRVMTSVRKNTYFTPSCFYRDMAQGKWLAYQHVPETVARLVAEKLGASLDII